MIEAFLIIFLASMGFIILLSRIAKEDDDLEEDESKD